MEEAENARRNHDETYKITVDKSRDFICGNHSIDGSSFCFFQVQGQYPRECFQRSEGGGDYLFTQDDPAWAADTLGTSSYTMASSGCLTTCIASIQNQSPGEMNRRLSDQSAYDAEGNLLWEELEKALEVKATRQDTGETSGRELEELLEKGIFPFSGCGWVDLGISIMWYWQRATERSSGAWIR